MFNFKNRKKSKLKIKDNFIYFDKLKSNFNSRLNVESQKGDIEIQSHHKDGIIRGETDKHKNGLNVDEVYNFLQQHYTVKELKTKSIWMISCSSFDFARKLSLKTKGIVYGANKALFPDPRYNENFTINDDKYSFYLKSIGLFIIFLLIAFSIISLFLNLKLAVYFIFSITGIILLFLIFFKKLHLHLFKKIEKTGTKKFIGYKNGIKFKD